MWEFRRRVTRKTPKKRLRVLQRESGAADAHDHGRGADVTLGNPITDSATLAGTAKQPGTDGVGPGGTINATGGAVSSTRTGRSRGPSVVQTTATPPGADGDRIPSDRLR